MSGRPSEKGILRLEKPVPLRAGQRFSVSFQFDRASDPEGFDRVVGLLASCSPKCNEGNHEDCLGADGLGYDCACDCHEER